MDCKMEHWQYQVPNYVDFNEPLSDSDDKFFETYPNCTQQNSNNVIENVDIKIKQEIFSPDNTNNINSDEYFQKIQQTSMKKEYITPKQRTHRRRSMSVNAIMENVSNKVKYNKYDGNVDYPNYSSQLEMKNRIDSQSKLTNKCSSISSLQSNSQSRTRYVPTAEAIYHLQKDTPERFHTYSKSQQNRLLQSVLGHKELNLKVTVPQSPMLISKKRNRPVTVLSQKELEDLEVEKMKQFKIKAQPISTAALLGIANLASVQRRPTTKPEPFNLTQIRKKIINIENDQKKIFIARPMPKHILVKPVEIGKPGHSGVPLTNKNTLFSYKPQPFSFENKDKERLLKKQEKIMKVLEDEKKMREFHANPIPAAVLKKSKSNTSHSSSDSRKENKENYDNKILSFKARKPDVLFKEPFVVHKHERPLLEPHQIELATEKRAKERDLYNQKLKQKEETLENMRKKKEEEVLQQEEKELVILRSQLVHKAAPIKHYVPMIIQPSDIPLTCPKSPNFVYK